MLTATAWARVCCLCWVLVDGRTDGGAGPSMVPADSPSTLLTAGRTASSSGSSGSASLATADAALDTASLHEQSTQRTYRPQSERVEVQISNTRPRSTVDGALVNAHDGMFTSQMPDGRFWLFGTAYQHCRDFSNCTYPCGWLNNTFAAYSSPTFAMDDWRLEGANILPSVAIDTASTSYFGADQLTFTHTRQLCLARPVRRF